MTSAEAQTCVDFGPISISNSLEFISVEDFFEKMEDALEIETGETQESSDLNNAQIIENNDFDVELFKEIRTI